MDMPGRKFGGAGRYGFNGKERDKDMNSLTAYDYGFRIYNPAIGRFLSVDPLTKGYPMLTPYQYASNRPIDGVDIDGLEWGWYYTINYGNAGKAAQKPAKAGVDFSEAKLPKQEYEKTGNKVMDIATNWEKICFNSGANIYNGTVQVVEDGVNVVSSSESRQVVVSRYKSTMTSIGISVLKMNERMENGEMPQMLRETGDYLTTPEGLETITTFAVGVAMGRLSGAVLPKASLSKVSSFFRSADKISDAAKGLTRSLDDLSSLRGATWNEAESLIPKDWIRGAMKKGEGIKFVNPAKKGEQILLEKGWPGAKDPLHAGPYMKVSRDGVKTRVPLAGNPTLK